MPTRGTMTPSWETLPRRLAIIYSDTFPGPRCFWSGFLFFFTLAILYGFQEFFGLIYFMLFIDVLLDQLDNKRLEDLLKGKGGDLVVQVM